MNRTAGFLIVALSGACFGALGLFGRLAYAAGADLPTLLFLRFTLAGGVLGAVMVGMRQKPPRGRLLVALILLGAVGYVSEAGVYFAALQYAPAGLVALLLYSFPALVALLQVVFFRERLGRLKWVAILLALCGTGLTADLRQGEVTPLGVFLGLLSALLYAVYVVTSARAASRAGPLVSSTVILTSAGLTFGVAMLARGPSFPTTALGWGAVVGLALISTVAAVFLFFLGMARIGPVNTSLVSNMEPLTAVVLSALFLDERLSLRQVLGGALILTAAVLLARSDTPGRTLPPARGEGTAAPG
ncbi:EamA family transporter [Myxococcus stipitatus]|uniref:DMT family transporter n=1 Tax=Myxococcus stipitatus TaxID=83455 RepID=UPI001F2E0B6D|nr:EamA family transporter [Myxococcus stipitatus]MCE9668685.1 EamA family transporter [Myxococcus stipitatus]